MYKAEIKHNGRVLQTLKPVSKRADGFILTNESGLVINKHSPHLDSNVDWSYLVFTGNISPQQVEKVCLKEGNNPGGVQVTLTEIPFE